MTDDETPSDKEADKRSQEPPRTACEAEADEGSKKASRNTKANSLALGSLPFSAGANKKLSQFVKRLHLLRGLTFDMSGSRRQAARNGK